MSEQIGRNHGSHLTQSSGNLCAYRRYPSAYNGISCRVRGRVQRRCCGRLLCRGVLCGSAFEKLRVMRGGLVTHNYAELWIWGVWYCC